MLNIMCSAGFSVETTVIQGSKEKRGEFPPCNDKVNSNHPIPAVLQLLLQARCCMPELEWRHICGILCVWMWGQKWTAVTDICETVRNLSVEGPSSSFEPWIFYSKGLSLLLMRCFYNLTKTNMWLIIRHCTVPCVLLPSGPSDTWEVNCNASICIKVWGMFCWQCSGATVWWPHRFSASTALWLWKKAATQFGQNMFLVHIKGEIWHCE